MKHYSRRFGDDKSATADEGVDGSSDELKGYNNEMIRWTVHMSNYKMSVQAHTDGTSKLYIYGWVDFNQNSKFDEDSAQISPQSHKMALLRLTFTKQQDHVDPSVKSWVLVFVSLRSERDRKLNWHGLLRW